SVTSVEMIISSPPMNPSQVLRARRSPVSFALADYIPHERTRVLWVAVGVDDKQTIRTRVWDSLQAQRAARFPGARGRIPNFVGAEAAARLLADAPEWHQART